MIFHEIYSVYYQTVAKILEVALDHPLKKDEICKIIEKYAFSESVLKTMVKIHLPRSKNSFISR